MSVPSDPSLPPTTPSAAQLTQQEGELLGTGGDGKGTWQLHASQLYDFDKLHHFLHDKAKALGISNDAVTNVYNLYMNSVVQLFMIPFQNSLQQIQQTGEDARQIYQDQ